MSRINQVWYDDINRMHKKYKVHEWMDKQVQLQDFHKLRSYLEFRLNFIQEELNETQTAFKERDAEEIVDGLIDICVVAIGTLDAFHIDADKAWYEVLKANLSKEVGIKDTRPNTLGLPDLVKPEGWKAPSHSDNHGYLKEIFDE